MPTPLATAVFALAALLLGAGFGTAAIIAGAIALAVQIIAFLVLAGAMAPSEALPDNVVRMNREFAPMEEPDA